MQSVSGGSIFSDAMAVHARRQISESKYLQVSSNCPLGPSRVGRGEAASGLAPDSAKQSMDAASFVAL